jgi:tRNA dimethylallyltransferase
MTKDVTRTKPVVIAGPTACGKSALAMALAERLSGELICADSRQVYVGMRVGTAGPSDDELARVPHHLFHVVDPSTSFDAGAFVGAAKLAIADITSRGHLPIVVGGTGLYLRSLRFGLSDVPPQSEAVRAQLALELKTLGVAALHARLAQLDPESATRIGQNDAVRVVRALEIMEITGKKPSSLRKSHVQSAQQQAQLDAHWLLLWPDRQWLAARLRQRVAEMLKDGLIEETKRLREAHPMAKVPSVLDTMGYEEAGAILDGKLTIQEAAERIFLRHNAYVKRQLTWFKKETWWQRLDPASPTLVKDALALIGQ